MSVFLFLVQNLGQVSISMIKIAALKSALHCVGTTKAWLLSYVDVFERRASAMHYNVGREFSRQWAGETNVPKQKCTYHLVLHLGVSGKKRGWGFFFLFMEFNSDTQRRFMKPSWVMIFPVLVQLASWGKCINFSFIHYHWIIYWFSSHDW